MQITVEETTALERKMVVSVPFEKIDTEISKQLKELLKTARIDGFRPGKAPESVIKRRFGYSIESKAIQETVSHSLFEALREKNLSPAAPPQLNFDAPYESGKPFVFTANFEIFPEITLLPYSDLVIEKVVAQILPEDIDKALEGMQKQQVTWQAAARAAQEGDKLSINFEGKVEGQLFDGGKAENFSLILGARRMIPGFEEGLINATAGQTLTLHVTFPEQYGDKALAGKPAEFVIYIHTVEAPVLPALDDDFAAKFGLTEGGIEKLRTEVQNTLTEQLSLALKHQLKAEVMTKLAKAYKDLEVPKALIQREAANLLHQMQHQFAQFKGAKLPDFNTDLFTDRAKERVILGLVINKIIEENQLKPAHTHSKHVDEKHQAESDALSLEDQVVEKILLEAMVVEKPGTAAEILSGEGRK